MSAQASCWDDPHPEPVIAAPSSHGRSVLYHRPDERDRPTCGVAMGSPTTLDRTAAEQVADLRACPRCYPEAGR